MVTLSLCIATFNRADFIVETLESIVAQLTPDVEVVVVDGASPDNTEQVMRDYCRDKPQLRYFREEQNSGVDVDYDKAVGYARGAYCWLFPDDDLLAPGALRRVLDAVAETPDLVVADVQVKDVRMERTLLPSKLPYQGRRDYGEADFNRLLAETGDLLSFIGATIIRRDLWLSRDRQSYFGSFFIHVGVIFQKPITNKVIVLGEPLIDIRYGNSMWTPRRFEIWAFKWPGLIWGFADYSDDAKRQVVDPSPWRRLRNLISFRARGAYSLREYRRFFGDRRVGWWRAPLWIIAILPGVLAHIFGTGFLRLSGAVDSAGAYELLSCSPHSNWFSRWIATVGRRTQKLAA